MTRHNLTLPNINRAKMALEKMPSDINTAFKPNAFGFILPKGISNLYKNAE